MRTFHLVLVLATALPVHAETRRYALILADPPVAERFHSAEERSSEAGREYRSRIEKTQAELRAELERRQIRVTGATQVLTNSVFVAAPRERERELRALPGVKTVMPLSRKYKLR